MLACFLLAYCLLLWHFCSQKSNFRGFWDYRGAKMAKNGLKMSSFHLFLHAQWCSITFEKPRF